MQERGASLSGILTSDPCVDVKDNWSPFLPYLLFLPLTERSRIRVTSGALRYAGAARAATAIGQGRVLLPSARDVPLALPVERVSARELTAVTGAPGGLASRDILVLDKRSWDSFRGSHGEKGFLNSVAGVVVLRDDVSPGKWLRKIPGVSRLLANRPVERAQSGRRALHWDWLDT